MEAAFVLVRLPFFLVAAFVIADVSCIALFAMTFYWLLILPPFWLVVLVPLQFLKAAFSNRPMLFVGYISASINYWWRSIVESPRGVIEVVPLLFGPLWRWLNGGPAQSPGNRPLIAFLDIIALPCRPHRCRHTPSR